MFVFVKFIISRGPNALNIDAHHLTLLWRIADIRSWNANNTEPAAFWEMSRRVSGCQISTLRHRQLPWLSEEDIHVGHGRQNLYIYDCMHSFFLKTSLVPAGRGLQVIKWLLCFGILFLWSEMTSYLDLSRKPVIHRESLPAQHSQQQTNRIHFLQMDSISTSRERCDTAGKQDSLTWHAPVRGRQTATTVHAQSFHRQFKSSRPLRLWRLLTTLF